MPSKFSGRTPACSRTPQDNSSMLLRIERSLSLTFDRTLESKQNSVRQRRPSFLSPAVPSFQAAKSRWSPPVSPLTSQSSNALFHPRSSLARSESELARDLFADACDGDIAGMQICLSHGASVNCSVLVPGVFEAFRPAKSGHLSPLAGAATCGKLDAAQFLLSSGAEINPCTSQSASSPLHQACRSNSVDIVRLLLERGADVNIGNAYKTTAIMYAVKYSSLDIVRLLVSYRPNLTLTSFIGSTALHWAVWSGKTENAKILLRARADPNHPAPDGNTALHYAITIGSASMVKCLLKYGADPLRKNEACGSPLQLAQGDVERRNEQIIAMLRTVIAMSHRH